MLFFSKLLHVIFSQIAIKIIEKQGATKEFLNKFLPREIDALQRLSHSNILQVYRLVETEKQVYFMLEIAHNGDLLDYINANRCLPESQARFVMAGISAGIGHCHSRGIIHRDLKCENIMITEDMNIRIGGEESSRYVTIPILPWSIPFANLIPLRSVSMLKKHMNSYLGLYNVCTVCFQCTYI